MSQGKIKNGSAVKPYGRFHLGPKKMAKVRARIAARRLEAASETVFPITDPAIAHTYLSDHPVRGHQDTSFLDTLWFTYVRIDPTTRSIEDDAERNTETEVWVETGPGRTVPDDLCGAIGIHDHELDCGGPTFDAALVALANRVHAVYGDGAPRPDSERAWRKTTAIPTVSARVPGAPDAQLDVADSRPSLIGSPGHILALPQDRRRDRRHEHLSFPPVRVASGST